MKNNLNALKSAMDRANTSLTSLPYPNGGEDAKNDIRTALNKATSASDVNRILPTTWSSDITSYKDMINELPSNRHNALNSRLSQTYPTSADQSSSVSELKKQIIETHKVSAVQEINNIQGLEQTRKNTFISSINAISSNTDYTIEQMNQKIEEIREQVSLANEARLQVAREQAQAEINKLPTGNTIRNNLSSDLNRASSISDYDTIKANAIQAKKELDAAKQNAQTAISKLPDGIEAKSNLNNEMASAKNKSDYESIKQKAEQEATKLRASIKERVRLKLLDASYAPSGTIDKRLNWVDQRYIEWFNGQVDNGSLENAINLERQFAATKFFEKVRLNNIMRWLKNKVGHLAARDNRHYMDMISKFEQYDYVSNIRYNNRTGIPYSDRNGNSRTADDFAVLYTQAIPFSTPSEAQDLFNTIFQWQSLFNGTSNVNYGYFKNSNRNSIIDKSMKLLNDDLSNKSLTLDKIYEYSTLVAGLGDPATLQNHINSLKSNVPYVRAAMAEDSTYYFDKDGHRRPTKPLLG
ncbi:hypothetical protein AB5V95_01385 [Metamycoplasma spumans]|uniref:hypothetical protein n=1 Tax=Metamycoplasma spumans TaxID=92406 RepID=UPI0034DDB593